MRTIKMNYPVIDPVATGNRIDVLRRDRGISVAAIRDYLGLSTTYAIYKWFHGVSMPSLDNLVAIGALLDVPLDALIVRKNIE